MFESLIESLSFWVAKGSQIIFLKQLDTVEKALIFNLGSSIF